MKTIKLSSKGRVTIPKSARSVHHWEVGQELMVVDVGDGILLKPKAPFEESTLDDVAGRLSFDGKAKTLDEMDAAIAVGIQEDRG